jgi:regulator of RNase E activity RraA
MSEITLHPEPEVAISADLIARWGRVPVTIISDILQGEGLFPREIRLLRPPGAEVRVAGLARTCACTPPDFGSVLVAIDEIKAGEILLIAAGGDGSSASIGERLSGALRHHKAAGLVCDGAVRDVAALATFEDFPVFCREATAMGPLSKDGGTVNAPVAIGSVQVSPGDLLVGDEDGMIALKPETAEERIEEAEARIATEDDWAVCLAAGETLQAIFAIPTPRRTG